MKNQDTSLKARKTDLGEQKKSIEQQISAAEENSDENLVKTLKSIQKTVNETIKNINKKNSHIVWPACTKDGPKRTLEKVREIVEKIENNEALSIDEAKGIVGHSLFLDIPYFNYIIDIPPEYLHSLCLGVGKKMIILTFNVGEIRQRNTTRKLSSPTQFNILMAKVKVVRECSRRARNLDFSVMKGQEYRNIILIFFPLVIKCIDKEAKEIRLWLLLSYMSRACVLPENEYHDFDVAIIHYCASQFYDLYEKLFNARNCTYYTHIIGSHMSDMRAKGPLTSTSAFGFESFYGEVRNSFTPGTKSALKQIFNKILLKRAISPHCCETSIFFSPKNTDMECNSLVYTFVENEYNFYQIMSMDDDVFECCKVGKFPTSFPETPTLNWAKVGVFKGGGISEETVQISKHDVAGKLFRVDDLLLTCSNNVLREK